jgi:hypothetical protein
MSCLPAEVHRQRQRETDRQAERSFLFLTTPTDGVI